MDNTCDSVGNNLSERIFGMEAEKGRWIFVVSGMIIQLCLGSVYAYSILKGPLEDYFRSAGASVSATMMQVPYIVFLVAFGFSMPLAGKLIEKYGPRKIGMTGGLLTGLGWFLSSFAKSPEMLSIVYGIIGGLGVGLAYNCPITTSARWFPDRRGLAVGLTVLGFGFSAAMTGPLIDFLTSRYEVQHALRILGIGFLAVIVLLSLLLSFPPSRWAPKGWKPEAQKAEEKEFTRSEMVKTPAFYALWICYTIGTLAGLMAIGIAKSVGLEVGGNAGMEKAAASALMTTLIIPFAACNGFGRPIFGALTDKLNPINTAALSFLLIIVASIMMYIFSASITVYVISFAILWLCLGGWLAIAPTATACYFGTKDYARNYGLVFTAYGTGATIGNLLAGQMKDIFGAYIRVFPVVAVLALIGMVIAFTMLKPPKSRP